MAESQLGIKVTANTSEATRALSSLGRQIDRLTNEWAHGFAKFATPITSLATGAGIYELTKKVMGFEDAVRKAGRLTNMTNAEMLRFRETLKSSAVASGASTDQMLALSTSALQVTKDTGWVTENLNRMAKAMMGSGASAEAVGDFMGTLQERFGLTGDEAEKFYSKLYSFSKQKGVTMKFTDFVGSAGKLAEDFKRANPKATLAQVQDYLYQSMFIGDPGKMRRIQTQFLAQLSIPSGKKGNFLGGLGFKKGDTVDVMSIIDRMYKKMGSLKTVQENLYNVFKRGSIDVAKLIDEYKEYEEALKKIDPTDLAKRAEDARGDFSSAMNNMQTAILAIGEAVMGDSLKKFSAWTKSLDEKKINEYAKAIKGLVPWIEALAKAFVALKVASFINNMAKSLSAQGRGGLGGGILGTPGNPMYVVVVGGGMGLGGVTGKTMEMGESTVGRISNALGKIAIAGAIGFATYEIVTEIFKATGIYSALEDVGSWLYGFTHGKKENNAITVSTPQQALDVVRDLQGRNQGTTPASSTAVNLDVKVENSFDQNLKATTSVTVKPSNTAPQNLLNEQATASKIFGGTP